MARMSSAVETAVSHSSLCAMGTNTVLTARTRTLKTAKVGSQSAAPVVFSTRHHGGIDIV